MRWAQEVGLASRDHFDKLDCSIEEVFPPLIITPTHQPHNVPARVQIERPWLAHQFHAGFSGELVAFAAVAGVATGHQIFPGGAASAGAGDDVVQREFARRQKRGAVLAGVAVAQQNVFAR